MTVTDMRLEMLTVKLMGLKCEASFVNLESKYECLLVLQDKWSRSYSDSERSAAFRAARLPPYKKERKTGKERKCFW